MSARIEMGRPNFDPRDIPTVQLTELGRALASCLRFPYELEEAIPKFFKEKIEKEAAKRSDITEDWFSAADLLSVQENLYEHVNSCVFHPEVEAGILKAVKRVLHWDDLDKELREEDIQRVSSLISWCLLIGVRVERQRKLGFKELLGKAYDSLATFVRI